MLFETLSSSPVRNVRQVRPLQIALLPADSVQSGKRKIPSHSDSGDPVFPRILKNALPLATERFLCCDQR